MQQLSFAITPLEFIDRSGIIRSIYGYSLLGKTEFFERLQKLIAALEQAPPDSTIAELYETDQWFRHNCDRCLRLNGIDPDWCDSQGVMLTTFLFKSGDGLGALVEYNRPDIREEAPPPKQGDSAGVEDVIASLWLAEGSYERAIEVASNRPYKEVIAALAARSEMLTPPEEKAKRKREKQAREVQEAIAKDFGAGDFFKSFTQPPIAS